MPHLLRRLKFPALLLLITIGFNWKLVLSGQYTWLDSGDKTNLIVPWLQVQAAQWHGAHFPIWDPHLWIGQPLVGMVQPGTLNPLNWILFSMPLKDGFLQFPVLHWYWVSIQFLAVLFAYLLCRDLALSSSACVLGGCAFGLGGFMGTTGWPYVMMSGLLLPLILMFFLRVLRRERMVANAAASGALLGASFLSGHHAIPIFFSLAIAALWIYYFIGVARPLSGKNAWPAAAFVACFALIAAAQILPSQEAGRLSVRWVSTPAPVTWGEKVPYSVHNQFSVRPTTLLGMVIPGLRQESPDFVGIVVLTLALVGATVKWELLPVRILSWIALGGLFFCMGGYSLFHGILYSLVPYLDKAREPSMATAVFEVGVAALAAYGLDTFRAGQARHWAHRISVRLLAALSLFLYAALVVLITVRPAQSAEYENPALAAFVAIVFAGLLAAWRSARFSDRTAGALAILLVLFELNPVSNYAHQPVETEATLHKLDDIAWFLKLRPDLPRVELDEQEIPYNFGDWFGVDQIGGYVAGAIKAIVDTASESRYQPLFAVNYFIGRNPKAPDQSAVFEGQSGLKVFTKPGAFPRARIVHAAISAPDDRSVIATVQNPTTDLRRTVVLPGEAPKLEDCDGGDVQVRRYRPTSIVLRTSSPCRAMVIFADAWFPGWKASVDGRTAQIYRAYNIVRGVVVEGGEHEVIMLYRPSSVFMGGALGGLGILLCIALQFRRDHS